MKRKCAVGAVVLLTLLGSAGTAGAGEITGKGKPTPIQTYRAGSICSSHSPRYS